MPEKIQSADTKVISVVIDKKALFKSKLRGDVKDRLDEISEAKDELDFQKDELIEKAWSDYWAVEHATTTVWDCPESPFGYCAYHKFDDRAWDNCLFCHQPYERK